MTAPKKPLTTEQIRECADSVQVGECITFPNGLVIDKRQLTGFWYWQQPYQISWTSAKPNYTPNTWFMQGTNDG